MITLAAATMRSLESIWLKIFTEIMRLVAWSVPKNKVFIAVLAERDCPEVRLFTRASESEIAFILGALVKEH